MQEKSAGDSLTEAKNMNASYIICFRWKIPDWRCLNMKAEVNY